MPPFPSEVHSTPCWCIESKSVVEATMSPQDKLGKKDVLLYITQQRFGKRLVLCLSRPVVSLGLSVWMAECSIVIAVHSWFIFLQEDQHHHLQYSGSDRAHPVTRLNVWRNSAHHHRAGIWNGSPDSGGDGGQPCVHGGECEWHRDPMPSGVHWCTGDSHQPRNTQRWVLYLWLQRAPSWCLGLPSDTKSPEVMVSVMYTFVSQRSSTKTLRFTQGWVRS